MRFARSWFCVFLVCVLCFVPFSVSVYAVDDSFLPALPKINTVPLEESTVVEEVVDSQILSDVESEREIFEEEFVVENEISTFALRGDDMSDLEEGLIKYTHSLYGGSSYSSMSLISSKSIYSDSIPSHSTYADPIFNGRSQKYLKYEFEIINRDNTILFEANSKISMTVADINDRLNVGTGYLFPSLSTINSVHLEVVDRSGVIHNIDDFTFNFNDAGTYSGYLLDFVNIDSDIVKVLLCYDFNIDTVAGSTVTDSECTAGVGFFNDFTCSFDIVDATGNEGFFASIIEWLTGIFDAIVELPGKIVDFVVDGLINLFVPDEIYMEEYNENWDILLSSRFGAVYQAGEIVSDYVSSFTAQSAAVSIDVPSVSIPVGEGQEFTFGGNTVSIFPEGFETFQSIMRTITSIVCGLAFINALKKRFEKMIGGADV